MTPRDAHLESEEESSSDEGATLVEASHPREQGATILAFAGALNAPRLEAPAPRPLSIVFDLDGTLVAEGIDEGDPFLPDSAFLRPGVQRFLAWCSGRGHRMAIWTAGHPSWAHYVSWKLLRVTGGAISFDFVWDGTMLRKRRRIPRDAHGVQTQSGPTVSTGAGACKGCCWCGPYRDDCDRCECRLNRVFQCPCRFTKDLNKVWKKKQPQYCRDRTLLIENTPAQCLRNYGNAVYVPTYTGNAEDRILYRLQHLLEQLEHTDNVRTVSKCNCCVSNPGGLHACREQSWWYGAGGTMASSKDNVPSHSLLAFQAVTRTSESAERGSISPAAHRSESFSPGRASPSAMITTVAL